MQDRQRYFEGRSTDTSKSTKPVSSYFAPCYHSVYIELYQLDVKAAIQETKDGLKGWSTNLSQVSLEVLCYTDRSDMKRLSQLRIERKAGDAAVIGMTQNVEARLNVKMRKSKFRGLKDAH